MRALAQNETDSELKARFLEMVRGYVKLAERAVKGEVGAESK